MNANNLHEYQKACVKHIIEHPYCGVFLDMGLGKTVTTLTAIEALMNDYLEVDTALIVAPKRVAESVWEEEARKWEHLSHLRFSKIIGSERMRETALAKRADIYIISRDNVAWLCKKYKDKPLPFTMLVIDELSSFKSNTALRFKALKAKRPYLKRVVGLTGTPAPNGLIDLWPQMYLIDTGDRLGKTVTSYRLKYFYPARSNGHIVYNYGISKECEKAIHMKISDICISMKAEDYLRMPPRTDNYIPLIMPHDLKKQYDRFEKDKVLELLNGTDDMDTVSAMNAAALSNKLLQFANGAVYDSERNVLPIHDIKLEALREIMESTNGQPVLVAWTYQFDRDRIKEALKAYSPRELKDNNDINDWNDGKIQLLLAHPASAGHGLNLQAGGNIIVWYGLTWSLELYQQFNARLYRQGQTSHVVINHLILKGTHDEDVVSAIKQKCTKQDALINSIKAKVRRYSSLS